MAFNDIASSFIVIGEFRETTPRMYLTSVQLGIDEFSAILVPEEFSKLPVSVPAPIVNESSESQFWPRLFASTGFEVAGPVVFAVAGQPVLVDVE